jgi:hypothetical protein
MTMETTKTDQAGGPAGEETQARQLARLTNDRLLKMRKTAQELSNEIDNSAFAASLADELYPEREALRLKAKEFKSAIEREYNMRVLRGYRSRFEELVKGLQPPPPPQEAGERRPIPINAAAAAQEDQARQQGEAIRTMGALVEQFHAILKSFNPTGTQSQSAEQEEGQANNQPPEAGA